MATPQPNKAETVSEMEKLGAPQELIDEITRPEVIEVLPMNWPILLWFREVADLLNWRFDGQCLGLDLAQVKAEADLAQRDNTKKHFDGLRLMGLTYAKTINKAT